MRSAHLNSTLQSESEIKSLRSGPSHRRSSPHRRREPLRARKHRVSCDSYRPNITLTQQVTAICSHGLAITKELPRPRLQTWSSHYSAICTPDFYFTVEDASGIKSAIGPVAQTRFPPSTPGAPFVRESTGFGAIPNVQTSPWRSNSTAICNHRCLANREK